MIFFKCAGYAILLIILVGACTESKDSSSRFSAKTPSFSAEIPEENQELMGEKIFMQYCKLCHGADGKLGLNGSKDITESIMPYNERILLIRNGKNTMTPFKEVLSEDEIEAVAKFTLAMGESENEE